MSDRSLVPFGKDGIAIRHLFTLKIMPISNARSLCNGMWGMSRYAKAGRGMSYAPNSNPNAFPDVIALIACNSCTGCSSPCFRSSKNSHKTWLCVFVKYNLPLRTLWVSWVLKSKSSQFTWL